MWDIRGPPVSSPWGCMDNMPLSWDFLLAVRWWGRERTPPALWIIVIEKAKETQ